MKIIFLLDVFIKEVCIYKLFFLFFFFLKEKGGIIYIYTSTNTKLAVH